MRLLLLLPLAVLLAAALPDCPCLNGGECTSSGQCLCPSGFIGQTCGLSARQLTSSPQVVTLTDNYSHLYFQPGEVNYYRLNFNVCITHNPARTPTLFYIETEKNNGSLRTVPSLFETAKLVLGTRGCTAFSTHYISIKRKEDSTYRKIVIGLKAMPNDDNVHYLNVYRIAPDPQNPQIEQNEQNGQNPDKVNNEALDSVTQIITVQMSYQTYIQNNSYASFIILFTACLLLIILAALINYLRRRYTAHLDDRLASEFREYDQARFRYYGRAPNPEQLNDNNPQHEQHKNSLDSVEVFMPVTLHGAQCCYFLPNTLTNKEEQLVGPGDSCAICLIEFEKGEEVRTTPCRHTYHRECIDNWCRNRLSCPICRHPLDFHKEIRRIYYHFLRGNLIH